MLSECNPGDNAPISEWALFIEKVHHERLKLQLTVRKDSGARDEEIERSENEKRASSNK